MNRRLALSALGAAALTLVPTAAMAYDAPGYRTTVGDPTPTAGEPITLTTAGAEAGEAVTATVTTNPASISSDAIQIAGTKAVTKAAAADGSVSFSVTLSESGTYTVAVTDSTGALLGDQVLTVAGAGGAAAPALGDTGFEGMELAVGAGALVLAGAGAVVVARRRQAAQAGV